MFRPYTARLHHRHGSPPHFGERFRIVKIINTPYHQYQLAHIRSPDVRLSAQCRHRGYSYGPILIKGASHHFGALTFFLAYTSLSNPASARGATSVESLHSQRSSLDQVLARNQRLVEQLTLRNHELDAALAEGEAPTEERRRELEQLLGQRLDAEAEVGRVRAELQPP